MRRRPPARVVRLRNLTLAPRQRKPWTDDLGYVLVWTAIATIALTLIVLVGVQR
jgi:hypothetical protein